MLTVILECKICFQILDIVVTHVVAQEVPDVVGEAGDHIRVRHTEVPHEALRVDHDHLHEDIGRQLNRDLALLLVHHRVLHKEVLVEVLMIEEVVVHQDLDLVALRLSD